MVPLNSKRLMTAWLKQLAAGLGIPTTSGEDLHSMIEGKLAEEDRDPLNILVVLSEVELGTHMSLQDETVSFL